MRVLSFLRLTDEDGNLSLTHAALIFACVCIWTGKQISLPDFGAFALALGAYAAKRHLAKAPVAAPPADLGPVHSRLDELSKVVAQLANAPALAKFGLAPRKP